MPEAASVARRRAALVITICASLLLLLHLALRFRHGGLAEGFDYVALMLVAVALLPAIARIFESLKVGGVELSFVREKLDMQGREIDSLKFLIGNYLTDNELGYLRRLDEDREIIIWMDWFPQQVQAEFRRLRGLGLIASCPGKTIGMMYEEKGEKKDARDYVAITDRGRLYLSLRASLISTPAPPAP